MQFVEILEWRKSDAIKSEKMPKNHVLGHAEKMKMDIDNAKV